MHKLKSTLLIALALASTHVAFARAERSMAGETLPAPTVEFLTTTPNFSGKPLIIEFWATWCPPCRKSIPHLNELYNKYKDQGLVIIGITKEKKKVVSDFLTGIPMDYFPALDPEGKYSGQFKVTGIPHALLVDKAGKVVWEGHPMQLNAKLIESVLK